MPDFRNHQCRGPGEYNVIRSPGMTDSIGGAGLRNGRAAESIDAGLALAHVIEHLMIDTVSFVTEWPTISGVTAAHAHTRNLFDVFVECPDAAVAPLAIYQSLWWVAALLHGAEIDGGGRTVLEVARVLFRDAARATEVGGASREVGGKPSEVAAALRTLVEIGFASRVPYAMNFSGLAYYRLCRAEGPFRPAARARGR